MGALLSIPFQNRNRRRQIRQLLKLEERMPNCINELDSMIEAEKYSVVFVNATVENWLRENNEEMVLRCGEIYRQKCENLARLEFLKGPFQQLGAEVDEFLKLIKCSKCIVSDAHISEALYFLACPHTLFRYDYSMTQDRVKEIQDINANYSAQHLNH